MSMRKMDIQIDIAREYEEVDKESFNRDLRQFLEKYFELNSIHIRKEIHTVEVQKLNLKRGEQRIEPHILTETLEIEREPLVTVFDSSKDKPPTHPKLKPMRRHREDDAYY
jgi:hypothetical protein